MKNVITLCFALLLCALNSWAQTSTPTPAATGGSGEKLLVSPQQTLSTDQPTLITKANLETPGSSYVRRESPVRIPRFEAAPVIDGQLNDAIWQTAAVFGDFVQTNPGDNVAPTHPTEFMMGEEAKNLDMAFRNKEEKNTMR